MEFQIHVKLQETNKSVLLAAMEWFVANYGTKIHSAQADVIESTLLVTVIEQTYSESVTTLQTINAQYSEEKFLIFRLTVT